MLAGLKTTVNYMKREGEGEMLQIKKNLKETNAMCYPAWILSLTNYL